MEMLERINQIKDIWSGLLSHSGYDNQNERNHIKNIFLKITKYFPPFHEFIMFKEN